MRVLLFWSQAAKVGCVWSFEAMDQRSAMDILLGVVDKFLEVAGTIPGCVVA